MKALILIGGKSARMGAEKHLLETNGKSQYLHLTELLGSFGLEVFVSCNEAQVDGLENGDFEVLVDKYKSIGPIGGIATAIENDKKTNLLVVACDLINLTKNAIQELIESTDTASDVVTYSKDEFLETTLTIYQTSSFQTILDSIQNKEYSLQKSLQKLKVQTIEPEDEAILKNVNRKEDLG